VYHIAYLHGLELEVKKTQIPHSDNFTGDKPLLRA